MRLQARQQRHREHSSAHQSNAELWSTPMTTIPLMIRARVDGIPGLAAKGHTGQQSKMGDQSRQLGQLSIDRCSSAAGSISISNPFINMLEASGNRRSPLQAEVVLRAFSSGPFRIVPHARLVERDGSPMPLGSRAFDLLCVLVSRPGEVVSRGELMAKVWPDLTVEESNLRFHIAQLRRALSDGPGGERYVTNVSRRGYCFVAPVGCAASPYIQHLYGRGDLSC
jgi:DNA-binding winged helix-turn-helix (wHTH) protein